MVSLYFSADREQDASGEFGSEAWCHFLCWPREGVLTEWVKQTETAKERDPPRGAIEDEEDLEREDENGYVSTLTLAKQGSLFSQHRFEAISVAPQS